MPIWEEGSEEPDGPLTLCSNCLTSDFESIEGNLLPTPSLTSADLANVQTVITAGSLFGLSEPVTVSWVLYAEKNWSVWKDALTSAGFTDQVTGSDGYAFLIGLEFEDLPDVGDSVGLTIELPNSAAGDSTGFAWVKNEMYPYTGYSFYWDNTNSEAIYDETWLCDAAAPDSEELFPALIEGYCYNFLPVKNGPGAQYRFTPKDLVKTYGWYNFSSSLEVFTLSESTVLMGAFALVSQATAVVVAALTVSF